MEEFLEGDTALGCRHIPGKKVVWRMEGYSCDRLSSAGFRDVEHTLAKPQGVTRVALLGDSACEGLQVPLGDTYARKLESLLNEKGSKKYEVLNFGCSSYSTGQEMVQFERTVASYSPDITVVLYSTGDAVESIRKPWDLKAEPRPYFYLDGQGRLRQDNAVLEAQRNQLSGGPLLDFLRRNSRIYGVLSHANLTLSINEPLYRKIRGWVMLPFTSKAVQPASARTPAYERQDGWKVTRQIILRLNNDCHAHNSRLLVLGFPNMVNDPESDRQLKDLRALKQEWDFDFFDLTPVFRWHPEPLSLFFKYHFSRQGHALMAAEIGNFILGRQKAADK